MIKQIINWILKHYRTWFLQQIDGHLTYKEVEDVLKKYTNKKFWPRIAVDDDKYRTTSYAKYKQILDVVRSVFPLDKRKYETDWFDCDDYADIMAGLMKFLMPGFCFGTVRVTKIVGGHKLNYFIDNNKSLSYYEPQTGKIFMTGDYKPFSWN